MEVLNSDLTMLDEKLFFYFRSKYRPEVINYLNEKHYFESINKIDKDIKKTNVIIWNALLLKEIISIGYTSEHLAHQYDSIYNKIIKCNTIKELNNIEIYMFNKYIDIIIESHESTEHLLVNKILHFLYMNIESHLSLKRITTTLDISQSYASKIFKEYTGMTIIKYSKILKIDRAKSLLKTSNESITSIGEKLGFHDQSHFTKTFKEIAGTTPIKYKLSER